MEFFELKNIKNKRPDTSVLKSLMSYNEKGLQSVFYQDGTLIVEEESFRAKPHIFGELRQELIAQQKLIHKFGVSSDELIAKEINRARVLAQSSKSSLLDNKHSEAQEMIEQIIIHAVTHNCSDVHIYLRNPNVDVRFRRDGNMTPPIFTSFDYQRLTRMAARLFNWTGANNSDGDFSLKSPQKTSLIIDVIVDGQTIPTSIRVEQLPLEKLGDAKIVLRVSPAVQSKTLVDMGVRPFAINMIHQHMQKPSGLIVVTGPTGSGKTTLLHAMLHEMPPLSTCSTLEDPVEVSASFNPLISQHNRDPNLGYGGQIKSLLRQDPNIIVIGEMRDQESAKRTITAALTGHLALTTLHTNNALGSVPRLADLGIPYADLAMPDVLSLLAAIRLVPVLCSHCKLHISEDADLYDVVNDRPLAKIEKIYMRSERGCKHCNGGIKGRKPILELINVDSGLRGFFKSGDIVGAKQYLIDNGWKSLQVLTWDMINHGEVCPIEAERTIKNIIYDNETAFNYSLAESEAEAL